MDVLSYLEAPPQLRPIKVEGLDNLFCKVLPMEELDSVIRESKDAVSPLTFNSHILALCVVRADGSQVANAEKWRKWPTSESKIFRELVKEVSRANGMFTSDEAEQLGKASAETGELDSSSSSASA